MTASTFPMRRTETWSVLEKKQEKDAWGDGTRLVLVVKRGVAIKDITVSGLTWDSARVGGDIELPLR